MPSKENLEVQGLEIERVLKIRRWSDTEQIVAVFHFGEEMKTLSIPLPKGRWEMIFDSSAERWQGPGGLRSEHLTAGGDVTLSLAPWSFTVYLARTEQVH
jgi:hypothetical protein